MSEVTQAHAVAMARVVSDIRDERRRQVEVLGYGPEHDDGYGTGALAHASICYLEVYLDQANGWIGLPAMPPCGWPWAVEYWKPSPDPRRNLIKAGALLAAEIERVDRLIAALAAAGGVQ